MGASARGALAPGGLADEWGAARHHGDRKAGWGQAGREEITRQELRPPRLRDAAPRPRAGPLPQPDHRLAPIRAESWPRRCAPVTPDKSFLLGHQSPIAPQCRACSGRFECARAPLCYQSGPPRTPEEGGVT